MKFNIPMVSNNIPTNKFMATKTQSLARIGIFYISLLFLYFLLLLNCQIAAAALTPCTALDCFKFKQKQ
jgi:hypothetical protein